MLDRDRQAATPFLAPGERLRAAATVSLAPGIPHPPAELLPPRQPAEWERKLARPIGLLRRARALVDPVASATGAVGDRIADAVPDAAWHGRGMDGGWTSAAGRFVLRWYEDGAKGDCLLALTDRRLLLLADRAKPWQLDPVYAPHHELPRHETAALRRNPKGVLQRGRVDLHFPDGSWAALTTPLPSTADELAAAYAS
ncbi:hypothetical protein Kpho02_29180 [Kitasatospora phosalacinea]|uniref:Uncharacterized protein n=1 Tax=Kitasatospora phosalacinea TaxID=2065 RepID=A0A9W6Q6C0_9ACTN|nr:hypothetical protein [Kitasatospora phosalacinea]GLW70619.1 hypothetical protein Kpho02_29180 [Kitasatospora phosalacinea]